MEIPNQLPNSAPLTSLPQSIYSRNIVVTIVGVLIILTAVLIAIIGYSPIRNETSTNLATAAAATETAFRDVEILGGAAIVIDLQTRKVLFEKNADAQLALASLTKVPLVLAAAEVLQPNTIIRIPREIRSAMGVTLFREGEAWSIQDIIDATLITSSNSGAEFLSELANEEMHAKYPLSPSEKAVLWRMNEIAKELGLSQTYFLNVSGLDISTSLAGSYGSARDVATMLAHAFEEDSSLFSGTARGGVLLTSEEGSEITAVNTNESESVIPGLIMGKTGFTDLAGGNLGVVFDVGIGHPVVIVVLGSTPDGRFADVQALRERTISSITSQ